MEVEELLPANAKILAIALKCCLFNENTSKREHLPKFYLILPCKTSKKPNVQVYRFKKLKMKPSSTRLFFIDAMRAWAILMMLQGHFIDGLLDTIFRNPESIIYSTWLYFRGITAPVFFTVSGFIFTYLLIRAPEKGLSNPRVKKGIRRGLQLLLIGYLLRLNLFGLLSGKIYDSFYLVDVLHCIGMSILAIIALYTLSASRKKWVFPSFLVVFTLLLFLFEPIYKQWSFDFFPTAIANYFTKTNGSVFTIIPWLGYATMGSFLSILFTRFKDFKYLYPIAIVIALASGLSLIFFSSDIFVFLHDSTGIAVFKLIELNNYLFIRLGDVFVVFAIFMMFRSIMKNNFKDRRQHPFHLCNSLCDSLW